MTNTFTIYDAQPVLNGTLSTGNRISFFGKMVSSDLDSEPVYDIDYDTFCVYFKEENNDYAPLIENGTIPYNYQKHVHWGYWPLMTGEGGTGIEATGDKYSRFFFVWYPYAAFPNGHTYWMKVTFDNINGDSYSKEWYFTTGSYRWYDIPRLSWSGSRRLGYCPYGEQVQLNGTLQWAKDNEYAPPIHELWVYPTDIPSELTVRIKINGQLYNITDWLSLTNLYIQGKENIPITIYITSNVNLTSYKAITLKFMAIGASATGINGTNTEGTSGIALLDVLELDFIGYMLSWETYQYLRSLGATIS